MLRLFKRYGSHRLMRIIRGYRFLKDSKSLSRIADIKRALTTQPLDIKDKHFSRYIFGEGVRKAEIICRQYLLMCLAGLNLNRALLHALGKPASSVVYYLPPEWRTIIRKKGFKLPKLLTALLWNVFVGIKLLYGIYKIAEITLVSVKALNSKPIQNIGRHVYFDTLASGNLPQPCRDGLSHDIITWYMQWPAKVSDIDTLCHGVIGADHKTVNGTPVIPVPSPILPLTSFSALMRFMAWGMRATLTATRDFLCGRWWHALLLNQAALAMQARMQNHGRLAQEYLFHNSSWIYRPLWTYEVEKRGARITFYFYSTNCEGFKQTEGNSPLPYGWQTMCWPHYLVWDEYQVDFLRRTVGESPKTSVVGLIWFHASAEEMPKFSGRGVAVFDVTPLRSSLYRTLGADVEFYVPKTCIQFLHDIQQVTEDAGYMMLWKCKRKIGSLAHPRYRIFAERLSESENVITVDPDISAHLVIEASTLVISMPFTSTALIARELGKPSCYYDSTGLVQQDDSAAHGIEILRGPEELARWINSWSASLCLND
jgi:polysaccharide biosynthesis PFTS motif protein